VTLAAGILPVSSSDLLHPFQPSPATLDPRRPRLPSFRWPRSRGGSNASHRAVNTHVPHRNHLSPIQRLDLWTSVRVRALCPWAPPVSACAPSAGPGWSARLPPQSLTPLARLSVLARAPRLRSRSDLILAVDLRSCDRDQPIPICLETC
jgi:hypothetical protein